MQRAGTRKESLEAVGPRGGTVLIIERTRDFCKTNDQHTFDFGFTYCGFHSEMVQAEVSCVPTMRLPFAIRAYWRGNQTGQTNWTNCPWFSFTDKTISHDEWRTSLSINLRFRGRFHVKRKRDPRSPKNHAFSTKLPTYSRLWNDQQAKPRRPLSWQAGFFGRGEGLQRTKILVRGVMGPNAKN